MPAQTVTDRPRWVVTRKRSQQPTVTHLRVFHQAADRGSLIAVVTELDANPGLSVTNAAELIEGQLRRQLGCPFRLFEHYPANRYGSSYQETFAEVLVTRSNPSSDLGAVTWNHVDRTDVETLIGGEF